MSGQHRDEHDEPKAIGAERHDDPIEQDDLPQRMDVGTRDEAERQKCSAHEYEASWSQPIDEHADKRRRRPANELRNRVGY